MTSGNRNEMRLFVWTDFSPDYKDGLAFAIAETIEQAMALVTEQLGYTPITWGTVEIHSLSDPVAFAVSGGS